MGNVEMMVLNDEMLASGRMAGMGRKDIWPWIKDGCYLAKLVKKHTFLGR